MNRIHEILLHVGSDADEPKRDLGELAAELNAFDRAEAEAELHLATGNFQGEIARARAQVAALDRQSVTIDVDVDTDTLSGKIAAALAQARGAGDHGGGGGPGGFIRSMNLGPFNISARAVVAILPILISLVTALGAAAIALGANVLGAAAALGALGLAAGAALGPLAAIIAGAIERFSSASEAAEDLKNAQRQVQSAAQGVADAERQVADAERAAKWAREDLTQARRDAAQQARAELTAALQQLDTAEAAHRDAITEQTAAQQGLNIAREEAIRTLEDLRFAAEGAAISEEQAAIALERARNRAREFSDDDRSLAARDARLAVEAAELRLREAREGTQRSTEDLADAERRGISGSDQVVAARARIADANEAVARSTAELADAQREVARATRASQRPSEQVVAARRALQQANRGVEDAERGLLRQTRELNRAQRERNKLLRESAALAAGTAGRELRRAGKDFMRGFREMVRGGSDEIYEGIADFLDDLGPAMRELRDEMTGLGASIGDSFRMWGAELSSPAWVAFFERMTDAAARIIPRLTQGAIYLARAFRDIADAAMPFLERGVDRFVAWSRSFSTATSDADRTADSVGRLVGMLDSLWRLTREGGEAIFNIGRGAAPAGQSWIDDMADGLERWNRWASSDEGQRRIRRFFDEIVPVARDFLGMVGKILLALVEWGELTGPVLRPIMRIIGKLADVAADLLDTLNRLPGVLGDIASAGAALGALALLRRRFGGGGAPVPVPVGGGRAPVPGPPMGAWQRFTTFMRGAGGPLALGAETILIFDKLNGAIGEVEQAQARLDQRLATQASGAAATARQQQLDAIHAVQRAADVSGDRALAILRRKFGSERGAIPWERLAKQANEPGGLAGKTFVQRAIAAVRNRREQIRRDAGSALRSALNGATNDAIRSLEGALNGVFGRKLVEAGKSIIDGLIRGFGLRKRALQGGLKAAGAGALAGLKNMFGIRSPSRVTQGYGEMLMLGLARGIDRGRGAVNRAMAGAGGSLNGRLRAQLAAAARGGGGQGGGSTTNNFNMPLTVPGGGPADPRAAAAAMSLELRRKGLSIA